MDRDLRTTTTGSVGPAAPPDQEALQPPDAPATWEPWTPPAPATGRSVPIGALLTIAVLTPAQTALVIADLLQAMGAARPDRVRAVLGGDGVVAVVDPDDGAPGVPVRELLHELVRNARRLPAHPLPHQVRLLHHVETQAGATGDPAERALALREALVEVVGPDAITRVRRELSALVEAFNGIAISRPTAPVRADGQTPSGPAIVRPHPLPPPGRAPRPASHRTARSRRTVGILAVLALVLVAGGYLLLRGPASGLFDGTSGGADGSAAHRPARSHARPHHQQAHAVTQHHATFPALAPQTAGRVRGIVLQRIGGCTPGGTCGVQVSVRLAPAGVSQPVTWRVGVARRCVRNVLWSPATTVTAQPGWSRVFASSSVPIPTKARSLALVALTSAPTRAQSRPVPVPGATLQC